MRVSYEEAAPFTRWFNFNPVSMQLRWLYSVWASGGTTYTRAIWLVYLRTLPLVPPHEFLGWLWMVTVGSVYRKWVLRPYRTLGHFFK